MRVLGHVELGTLRGAGGGVGIAGSLDVARARIELRARSTFAPATALRGGEVTLRLWSAGARGGFVPRWGRLELALMGGVEFGVLTAHARGLPQARGGRVAWSSLVVGPGLVFRPHPRIGLWLDIDGFVTLLRPRIGLDDDSLVHQPAPGGFRASAGVGVRFGRSGTVTDRSRRRQPIPEDPAR